MMATSRDPVLIVIEPVHERLDGDGKYICGTNKFATSPKPDAIYKTASFRADDVAKLLGIQQRAIGNPVHRLIEINVARDVGGHTEALDEERNPTTVGMAARNGF